MMEMFRFFYQIMRNLKIKFEHRAFCWLENPNFFFVSCTLFRFLCKFIGKADLVSMRQSLKYLVSTMGYKRTRTWEMKILEKCIEIAMSFLSSWNLSQTCNDFLWKSDKLYLQGTHDEDEKLKWTHNIYNTNYLKFVDFL